MMAEGRGASPTVPGDEPDPRARLGAARIAEFSHAVRMLAAAMLDATKVRIVRMQPVDEPDVRWRIEVEAFIPNPELTITTDTASKIIFDRGLYRFDFDETQQLRAFAPVDSA
jgi:hypothetical protein